MSLRCDRDAARAPAQPTMPFDDRRRQLASEPIEGDAPRPVLEPRDRRLRREVTARHRVAPEQQLVDRVVGEPVRVLAVGVAARDAETPAGRPGPQAYPETSPALAPSTRHRANALTSPRRRRSRLPRSRPQAARRCHSEFACSRSNVWRPAVCRTDRERMAGSEDPWDSAAAAGMHRCRMHCAPPTPYTSLALMFSPLRGFRSMVTEFATRGSPLR